MDRNKLKHTHTHIYILTKDIKFNGIEDVLYGGFERGKKQQK